MVVADPDATLLTVCELGYGKRTWFGAGEVLAPLPETEDGEEGDSAPDVVAESEPAEAAEADGR